MEDWLASEENLAKTNEFLANEALLKEVEGTQAKKTLQIFKRTFECYQMAPEAKELREKITAQESELEGKRNGIV